MTRKKSQELQILLAGFGGQGIVFMGKMLSYLALLKGKNVTWIPSYGAEVRGGTAHSMVIISNEDIASPYVSEPDMCVVMNELSLRKFAKNVKKQGTLIINSSLCHDKINKKDIKIIKVPATQLALDMGEVRVANMVLLGLLAKKLNLYDFKKASEALENLVPLHRKNLIPLNEIIAESLGVTVVAQQVSEEYKNLIKKFNNEFNVLLDIPKEELASATLPEIAEGIMRVREGKVLIEPGYDGVYGKIRIFSKGEQKVLSKQETLF